MDKLIYLLPVLACPAMMGAMMWFMARSGHRRDETNHVDGREHEFEQLRAEVERLRENRRDHSPTDGNPVAP